MRWSSPCPGFGEEFGGGGARDVAVPDTEKARLPNGNRAFSLSIYCSLFTAYGFAAELFGAFDSFAFFGFLVFFFGDLSPMAHFLSGIDSNAIEIAMTDMVVNYIMQAAGALYSTPPCTRRYSSTTVCWPMTAMRSNVRPPLSRALRSAPCSTSILITSKWPL